MYLLRIIKKGLYTLAFMLFHKEVPAWLKVNCMPEQKSQIFIKINVFQENTIFLKNRNHFILCKLQPREHLNQFVCNAPFLYPLKTSCFFFFYFEWLKTLNPLITEHKITQNHQWYWQSKSTDAENCQQSKKHWVSSVQWFQNNKEYTGNRKYSLTLHWIGIWHHNY